MAVTNSRSFALAKHLSDLDLEIKAPEYLKEHSILDLSSLIPVDGPHTWDSDIEVSDLLNIDVLDEFPFLSSSDMDSSQMAALERMTTQSVAVVQGPPGTGKTFTSVCALKVLLANMCANDPPIIIAAQTNHAVDQLLKHVLAFEEKVVRLGSRTDRENEDIIKRTLYELRKSTQGGPNCRRELRTSKMQLEQHIDKIARLLAPFLSPSLLTSEMLLSHGLISEEQKESLCESGWYEGNGSQRDADLNAAEVSSCK